MNNNRLLKIEFYGKDKLAPWSVTHYLQKLSSNHLKITLIEKVIEQLNQGIPLKDILISKDSIKLFPNGKEIKTKEFHSLSDKNEDFWKTLLNHHRPMIFIKKNKETIPIFQYNNSEAFKIHSLIIQSPPKIEVSGLGSSLIELIFAKSKNKREKIKWENEQISQSVKNIEDIVKTRAVIEDSKANITIKEYAKYYLEQLIHRQGELNNKFGVNQVNIDQKA